MIATSRTPLGAMMARDISVVDPSRFPEELFDLYSIPAFDNGQAEIVTGNMVGSNKQVIYPDDVLLSRIVPHIRRAWVVGDGRGRRMIASGEWIVFRSNRVCPQYLKHILISDPFHVNFMLTVTGVGGSLLRARPINVAKIEISLPSLQDQKRVANILDSADHLRINRRFALTHFDTLIHSIYFNLFGDLAQNERGWGTRRVSDCCDLVRGSSPRPQGDSRYFGGPVPRLMVADITRDGWLVTPRIDSLTIEGAKLSRPIQAGTVVMAVSGNIGLVSRLAVDACVHDGFVAFNKLDETACRPEFLLAFLHFSKSLHTKNKAGAIFINLTTTDIKSMKIPLPPVDLQDEFIRRLGCLDKLKSLQNESLNKLDELFTSLQSCAFRGEL